MSSTIRRDVKAAIAAILQSVTGVSSVYTYSPRITSQVENPRIVVHLSKSKETRISESAPIGKKKIDFTAQLEIYAQDLTPDGAGQVSFEAVLDDIDVALRQNLTLGNPTINGGILLAAGLESIDTTVAPPMLATGSQTILLLAVKQFDVLVQVTG